MRQNLKIEKESRINNLKKNKNKSNKIQVVESVSNMPQYHTSYLKKYDTQFTLNKPNLESNYIYEIKIKERKAMKSLTNNFNDQNSKKEYSYFLYQKTTSINFY